VEEKKHVERRRHGSTGSGKKEGKRREIYTKEKGQKWGGDLKFRTHKKKNQKNNRERQR